MVEEVRRFIDNGTLNSENFFLDDGAASQADQTRVSVGGSFEFLVSHRAPHVVTVVGGPRGSRALRKFQERLASVKHASVTAALTAATKEYLKVTDELDAEVAAEDEDGCATGGDTAAAPPYSTGSSALDESMADARRDQQLEQTRKLMEMEQALTALRQQYDIAALPKPAIDRILSDYSSCQRSKHHGWSAGPVGRNLARWAIDLFDFDKDTPLFQDMAEVGKRTGKTSVELLMEFPPEYPFKPPFIRVVRPRFQFRTGHVTIGGSICTQLLTEEGWKPIYDVESIIETIRQQITDKESGAKIDHANTADYSESEARDAFRRMVEYHKANGW